MDLITLEVVAAAAEANGEVLCLRRENDADGEAPRVFHARCALLWAQQRISNVSELFPRPVRHGYSQQYSQSIDPDLCWMCGRALNLPRRA